MAIMFREKMIAEWQANERKRLREMDDAMSRCKNEAECRRCFDAYCDLINQETDKICQSYGAQPMLLHYPRSGKP